MYAFADPYSELGTAQSLQEDRLIYDQRQLFAMDDTLKDIAQSRDSAAGSLAGNGAPVYKVVYFAGFTEAPVPLAP